MSLWMETRWRWWWSRLIYLPPTRLSLVSAHTATPNTEQKEHDSRIPKRFSAQFGFVDFPSSSSSSSPLKATKNHSVFLRSLCNNKREETPVVGSTLLFPHMYIHSYIRGCAYAYDCMILTLSKHTCKEKKERDCEWENWINGIFSTSG